MFNFNVYVIQSYSVVKSTVAILNLAVFLEKNVSDL
jgi:hypothetical protein